MYKTHEYEALKKEFNQKQKIRRKKLTMIWSILLFVSLIFLGIVMILFQVYAVDDEIKWVFFFIFGTTALTMAIGLMITLSFTSEKPYFEYVFPSIVQKINDEEGLFLTYKAYPKSDKTINQKGGLFTKYASISTKRCLSGYSSDQYPYSICDMTMTTSNGNSQVTHFDGSYIYLEKQGQTDLQIRTTGSPKLKGVKFQKLAVESTLKVYKPNEQDLKDIDRLYLRLMESLKKDERYRHLYLSINHEGMHLGIWYKKHPIRKKKPLSIELLNQYQADIINEIKFVNQLEAI
ncbi:hypothetical protein BK011_08910 [Tenericutes bacterium MZ-XQ]|nr:hypothetical protein BK011_08910 [Tenericutes bacterium MZ-XQ]